MDSIGNRLTEPLPWLLGDAADGFLTGRYEREPVIVHHGDPDRFRALLSIAAVDRKVACRSASKTGPSPF